MIFSNIIFISTLLASVTTSTITKANNHIAHPNVDLKEIISVKIKSDDTFDALSKAASKRSDGIFVEFENPNCIEGEEVRRSQDLSNPHETYFDGTVKQTYFDGTVAGAVSVNSISDYSKGIKCRVLKKERILFLPARMKLLAEAEFDPHELILTSQDSKFVKKRLKYVSGTTSWNRSLEIELVENRWDERYQHAEYNDKNEEMDPFFSAFGKSIKGITDATRNPPAFELKRPKEDANPNLPMQTPMKKEAPFFQFPSNDEMEPLPFYQVIGLQVLNAIYPVRDRNTLYKNRADGTYGIRQTVGNNIAEPKEGMWLNPTRDSGLKRFFFSSIGMFYVKKKLGFEKGFIADLCKVMKKYPVRQLKGEEYQYEPWGSKAYFDEHGNVEMIKDSADNVYKPGDEHWEWAKMKCRSDVFAASALLHLGSCHYVWGNYGGTSLRKFLPPKHPIRMAFTAHFFKTHYTCRLAQYALFPKRGFLARGNSIEYEKGLKQGFIDFIRDFEYETYPEEIKRQGLEHCKFHVGAVDGMDLHSILTDYVSEVFDEQYSNDLALSNDEAMRQSYNYLARQLNVPQRLHEFTLKNVKEVWSETLFRITGYHSSIGAVISSALDPAMVNIRIRNKGAKGNLNAPKEASATVALISALTQVDAPTLGQDWKQTLEDPNCKSYANLRARLNDLEEKIDERNKVRDKNVDYHPRFCTLSVSS